jgi:hypothetical protein
MAKSSNLLVVPVLRWALWVRDRDLIQQSLRRLLASSAMAVTLFVGAAHAEQNDGYYVFGKGVSSTHCSDFLQAVDVERKARIAHPATAMPGYSWTYTDEFRRFADFADGFLSGTNFASENERMTGQGTEVWGRALWIKNWCQQRPLEEYITALIALRAYLVTQ